ncbi:hypothetical protein CUMW_264820 [Citrus unshiu]|uniref:C-JID domain-containing protein n=1 Tax=Citrus unshiu TaxID=55188 RepID=A0A2H5QV80_CITUN|nr:hypothetical protein CUMW_264820 [Citrus unshiu]
MLSALPHQFDAKEFRSGGFDVAFSVRLPASINCLFNLENLELEDCKRLQSQPQLPPNVTEVRVNGCASLVTLLGALKLRKSSRTIIDCVDSLKLLGKNGLAISMLREYLEAVSDPDDKLSIVVPGSEIPKWFTYQNEGSSITVTRPSYLYNMNKGIALAKVDKEEFLDEVLALTETDQILSPTFTLLTVARTTQAGITFFSLARRDCSSRCEDLVILQRLKSTRPEPPGLLETGRSWQVERYQAVSPGSKVRSSSPTESRPHDSEIAQKVKEPNKLAI